MDEQYILYEPGLAEESQQRRRVRLLMMAFLFAVMLFAMSRRVIVRLNEVLEGSCHQESRYLSLSSYVANREGLNAATDTLAICWVQD